ncbi:MAG: 50S ribosomal protein L24 [Candidatus Riflebacteria bacterium]|nr:50S ribosomal protein L24 [Candidatus Riflebacteria bacterium]
MHVKKGDTVKVIAGKDRGKQGRVMLVYPQSCRVMVEKLNLIKRHQRPTQRLTKGGIIEKENPIHASNVMLVCTRCKEPTRVKHEVFEGKRIRICKKCDEQIDKT